MIQHKTMICFSPCVYIIHFGSHIVKLHVYYIIIQEAHAALYPCGWIDSAKLLRLYFGSGLIVTYRARPPADFWCKMQFALLFVSAPPQRSRESSIIEGFSHVRVLSAAGWTDWITVCRDLKKTQWTSNRVLGPPLWSALAMEVTNHWMYPGKETVGAHLWKYLSVCVPLCFLCVQI